MNQSVTILNKLNLVERDLQELKITVYRSLPRNSRLVSRYADQALLKASKTVRDDIWQQKYAKKIKAIS